MVLKLGHFRRQNRSTWKVLKCDAGEGWGRVINVRNEVLPRVKVERNIL
jgi:hypothetical protein